MNTDGHCTISIDELVTLEKGHLEITVPEVVRPKENSKEFFLDDLGVGWTVKLKPVESPHESWENVYWSVIENKYLAYVKNSCLIIESDKSAMELLWP